MSRTFTCCRNSLNIQKLFCFTHIRFRLETYTLRSGYHTVQEAENINNINNACPDGDNPICLVGLRPFIAAKHLLVSGSHLVLLASSEQDPYRNPSLPTRSYSSENPADASETTSKISTSKFNRFLIPTTVTNDVWVLEFL